MGTMFAWQPLFLFPVPYSLFPIPFPYFVFFTFAADQADTYFTPFTVL